MSRNFTDWQGDFLVHHGIKGQKWGVRRYQNEDGSYTEAGKKHNYKLLLKSHKAYSKGNKKKAAKILLKSAAYQQIKQSTQKERDAFREARKNLETHEEAFYKDYKKVDKYRKMAAKRDSERYGGKKEDYLKGYRQGDLDQGVSYDLYTQTNKKAAREVGALRKKLSETHTAHNKKVREEADRILGSYGNKSISNTKKSFYMPANDSLIYKLFADADEYNKKAKGR